MDATPPPKEAPSSKPDVVTSGIMEQVRNYFNSIDPVLEGETVRDRDARAFGAAYLIAVIQSSFGKTDPAETAIMVNEIPRLAFSLADQFQAERKRTNEAL